MLSGWRDTVDTFLSFLHSEKLGLFFFLVQDAISMNVTWFKVQTFEDLVIFWSYIFANFINHVLNAVHVFEVPEVEGYDCK